MALPRATERKDRGMCQARAGEGDDAEADRKAAWNHASNTEPHRRRESAFQADQVGEAQLCGLYGRGPRRIENRRPKRRRAGGAHPVFGMSLLKSGQVFAYPEPCDMRKSFNTLSALVLGLKQDVLSGALFVFVARNRKRAKVLYYDGTGLCLLAKRLDQGTFAPLWKRDALTESELRLFLDGSKFVVRENLIPKKKKQETSLSASSFL